MARRTSRRIQRGKPYHRRLTTSRDAQAPVSTVGQSLAAAGQESIKVSRSVRPQATQTDAHEVFAIADNERLYITPQASAFDGDAMLDMRPVQALMRHLAFVEHAFAPSESMDSKQKAIEEIEKDIAESDADGLTSKTEHRFKRSALSKASVPDEELQSPFGDIISSIEEVIQARHAGRYMPASAREKGEQQEKQDRENTSQYGQNRVRPISLHPAVTLRYYTPPNAQADNRANFRRKPLQHKAKSDYPAAVPKEGIFAIMPPETTQFYERAQAFLGNDVLIPRGATLLVAVSGGVDSLSLLDILVWLQRTNKYKIVVVHINHRLRGRESEEDEYFVRETAKRYGLACYVGSADITAIAHSERLSIEHAAREIRYNVMEFLAHKLNADAVCTAHTVNDSVETLLMNLLRGAGLTGLSGIPKERALGTMSKVIRPLIGFKKADLLRYAALRKLSWREDASNALAMYTRNNIRHNLIPMLESQYSSGVVDVLQRTAHILQGADELVRDTVERLFPSVLADDESQPYIGLRVKHLLLHSRFLQREIVARAMTRRFGVHLSFDAIERVLALVDADTSAKVDISRAYFAVRDREMILLAERLPVTDINVRVEKNNHYDFGGWRIFLDEIDRKNVKFTSDPAIEFFDSSLLPYRLTLRRWQAGDVFTPLGMKGTMKVSDFLTNSKISFFNRQHVLVLACAQPEGEKIVWICGLRLNDHFKVHPHTERALRVEFRRPKALLALSRQDSYDDERSAGKKGAR